MSRPSKWSFASGLPTKTLYAPLLSVIRATFTAHLILDLIILITVAEYTSQTFELELFHPEVFVK